MSASPPESAAPPITPGINARAAVLVENLIADSAAGVLVRSGPLGVRLIDGGIDTRASVAAGLAIARICMGGLGQVVLRHEPAADWPAWIEVSSDHAVIACLASQYAGWSLAASKEETGGRKFFALGSGPARALARKEPLFDELGYRDHGPHAVLVLETDRVPPQVIVEKLLRDCAVQPDGLTLVLTPTTSLAGTTQVVARVLEVALHKAHTLGFPLANIVAGRASAPLPLPSPDGVEAMGRTNDAILYGGSVHLLVEGDDEAARDLARRLPSSTSTAYGQPFAQLFRDAGFDFYKLDPQLFAPAAVWVSNRSSGNSYSAGRTDLALLRRWWSSAA
jgi:methenyltetrahydromethanopterin cyclohydrolase